MGINQAVGTDYAKVGSAGESAPNLEIVPDIHNYVRSVLKKMWRL